MKKKAVQSKKQVASKKPANQNLSFYVGFGLLLVGCLYYFMFRGHKTVYASLGDFVALSDQVQPSSKSFPELTASYLSDKYPRVKLIKLGTNEMTADQFAKDLPVLLGKFDAKTQGPLTYATLEVGLNDLLTNYKDCDDCAANATLAQGTERANTFKKNIEACVQAIQAANPNCQIVLCTIPDPSNGGASKLTAVLPKGLIQVYNKKIQEVAKANNIPVADTYAVMMGHADWYVPNTTRPDSSGNRAMAVEIEGRFDTFPTPTIK